jgi:transposase-like protein
MVLEQGYTIQKTSDTLGINASTARMILKKYKDEGKIFERKDEQKVR